MIANLQKKTVFLTAAGILCAAALALSAAESFLPVFPMLPPGAKPGLSNLATMLAASFLGLTPAVLIAVCKGVFALITRGVFAGLLSLCGGLFSTVLTFFLLRTKRLGYVGIGIGGAAAHNAGQLLAAALLLTPAMVGYLPWLLLFSLLSGTLTGVLFGVIHPRLQPLLERKLIQTG